MKIRTRIVVPYVILFSGAFAALIVLAIMLLSEAVERRIADQVRHLSQLMSTSGGFALNPQTLQYIKKAFDAEIAIVPQDGHAPTLTTLTAAQEKTLSEFLRERTHEFGPDQTTPVQLDGTFYQAAAAPLRTGTLVLLFPGNWIADEKARAIRPFLIAAIPALVLVVLLGYLIASRIARPIAELAGQARVMASGKLDRPITASAASGEIGELAQSLSIMVEGLKKYQETLVQTERLATMGAMAAGVAHEIRNPLTSLKMTLQMLARNARPDDHESYRLLLREIERLELAVSELITAAQEIKLNKERVPLGPVVDDVLALLEKQLEHLSVTMEKSYNAPLAVEVDVARFKRAIMNLVLNGAQAMVGGGMLTIAIDRTQTGTVRLSVRDRGPGIPKDVQDKIFEPFVTTKAGGTGLGLSVTRRVVEEHGGTMGFETSSNGSTFWIDLPYAEDPRH